MTSVHGSRPVHPLPRLSFVSVAVTCPALFLPPQAQVCAIVRWWEPSSATPPPQADVGATAHQWEPPSTMPLPRADVCPVARWWESSTAMSPPPADVRATVRRWEPPSAMPPPRADVCAVHQWWNSHNFMSPPHADFRAIAHRGEPAASVADGATILAAAGAACLALVLAYAFRRASARLLPDHAAGGGQLCLVTASPYERWGESS